jgi:hypothetical protein
VDGHQQDLHFSDASYLSVFLGAAIEAMREEAAARVATSLSAAAATSARADFEAVAAALRVLHSSALPQDAAEEAIGGGATARDRLAELLRLGLLWRQAPAAAEPAISMQELGV